MRSKKIERMENWDVLAQSCIDGRFIKELLIGLLKKLEEFLILGLALVQRRLY